MTGARRFAVRAAGAAVVVAAAAAVAARFAPPPQVAILSYAAVAPDADVGSAGDAAVPAGRFFMQMRDLSADGWTCVSPLRVRLRALFALPLPRRAFAVVFESFDPALAQTAEPALAEYGFRAFAALPPDASDELRAAAREADAHGVVRVAGLRRRRGGAAARLFGDLPRIRVPGGRRAFRAEAHRDSVDPAFFGTLLFSQEEGVPEPCALLVYGEGDMAPAAQADVPALAPGETFSLPIPAKTRFPLDVVVYDPTRTVWQFGAAIPLSAVLKKPGWRAPAVAPDAEIVPPSVLVPPDIQTPQDTPPAT